MGTRTESSEDPDPVAAGLEPAPPVGVPDGPMCRCGHPEDVHEHYRRGHDCGVCGAQDCPAYRPIASRSRRG